MDSLAELTINQQKGLMSMYASQTDSHHSNVRWPKCALLKKKKDAHMKTDNIGRMRFRANRPLCG